MILFVLRAKKQLLSSGKWLKLPHVIEKYTKFQYKKNTKTSHGYIFRILLILFRHFKKLLTTVIDFAVLALLNRLKSSL